MALSKIVARLSVITMESVRNPAVFAAGESSGMKTRLGWPRRAGLLVIIETKTCGSPVPRSLASTTRAGRCLKVTRSLFGNHTSTTSPRSRPVIGFHPRRVPVLLPGGELAAHFGGLAERQRRGRLVRRITHGQLLDDFEHRRLRRFRQRLRLVEYFFGHAHKANLGQTHWLRKRNGRPGLGDNGAFARSEE